MRRIVILASVTALVLGAGIALAQEPTEGHRDVQFYGLGPRVGFSLDPDQFVFGGHMDMGDPFPHITWLIPVVELGIGDDATVTTIGSDLFYRFYDRWGAWSPYVGGELNVVFVNPDHADTQSDLGLAGLAGVEKGIGENRFGLELKFDLIDNPDFKFIAHWTFGH